VRISKALVWIFNLEGTVDLAAAITLGTTYGADKFMGAAYWIPSFWVPALLVTHYITWVYLLRYWKKTDGCLLARRGRSPARSS
jgi:hypothetical protein